MDWREALEDLYQQGMVAMPSSVVLIVSATTFAFLHFSLRKTRIFLEDVETMMDRRSETFQQAFPQLHQSIEMLEEIETMMKRRSKQIQQAVPELFESDDQAR